MNTRITLIAGLTALFTVGSVHAQAVPVCPYQPPPGSTLIPVLVPVPMTGDNVNPETGHTFDVFKATGISWLEAKRFVDCLPAQGSASTKAHLATITSSGENDWIVNRLLTPVLGRLEGGRTQVWVGGEQAASQGSVGAGWSWVNSEGPFAGVNDVGVYTNWSVDDPATGTPAAPINETEPNDAPTAGENNQENHLTLGRFANNLGAWNDEGSNLSSIGGFIVEYDTPRLVSDCQVAGGCETVEGQKIQFPLTATGNSFTFAAYEFTDPRIDPATGRCDSGGRRVLELFTSDDFNVPGTLPGSMSGKITIPPFLCGSPKFLIVRALENNGAISVPSGVVITTNKTRELAPGVPGILPGNSFDCNNPIPTLGTGNSSQKQDVGVWQDLNPANMREFTSGNPAYAGYFGSVAELTTACGSTVLQTTRKSNFLVGLHYDFGVTYRSAAEYQAMLDLTKKKVSLTLDSVNQAIADKRFIKNPDGQAMQSQLTAVLAALNKNDLTNARRKIQDFLDKVNASGYTTGTTLFNYNGDHLSRGGNIRFMLDHKLIPFKNSPAI